jgi:hypothetical protein
MDSYENECIENNFNVKLMQCLLYGIIIKFQFFADSLEKTRFDNCIVLRVHQTFIK